MTPNQMETRRTSKIKDADVAKKCEGSDASNKSCRDGVRKSMCPCVASGTGCSELCRSVNCDNIFQARIATESPAIKENDKGS